jgi:hypothetical protein
MKILFQCFLLSIALHACTYNNGLITSQTHASASQQVEYTGIAIGYSKANYFLGLGGFQQDFLMQEAKRNLFFYQTLKPNQTLENITYDQKVTRIGPFKKREVVVFADIVTHLNNSYIQNRSNTYNALLSQLKSRFFITINDSVYIKKGDTGIYGKVVGLDKSKVSVFYLTPAKNFKINTFNYANVYRVNPKDSIYNVAGIRKGDSASFQLPTDANRNPMANFEYGKVLLTNYVYVFLETKTGLKTFNIHSVYKYKAKK